MRMWLYMPFFFHVKTFIGYSALCEREERDGDLKGLL